MLRRTYAASESEPTKLTSANFAALMARWPWIADDTAILFRKWRWSVATNRLMMPVLDPVGNVRAYVLRALDKRKPKALVRPMCATGALIGWHEGECARGALVLVEDPISAMRLSLARLSAVSLNGTTLTAEACAEIVDYGSRRYQHVHVALDGGATAKGLRIVKQLRGQLPGVGVGLCGLTKDFKDMAQSRVDQIVEALRG